MGYLRQNNWVSMKSLHSMLIIIEDVQGAATAVTIHFPTVNRPTVIDWRCCSSVMMMWVGRRKDLTL